ncbi:hypothetical protein ACJMK2_018342 [Sinanodonta woodiana]|uniref:MRH domain-containing protein n=1 Tax=Sinanodonta woodiana TaxID=1069815 RepID=A0ABD3UFV4_SINWO
MYAVHIFSLSVLLYCLNSVSAHTAAQSCMYKDPATGKVYDLRPLINPQGFYKWTQSIWSIGGNSLDSLSADTQMNVTFYLQVCKNLATPPPPCKDVGFAYSVTDDGTCTSWGNVDVATFDVVPFQDGIFLQAYYGTVVNHFSRMSSNVYFICNQFNKKSKATAEMPTFEHVKASINQAHFRFETSHAC